MRQAVMVSPGVIEFREAPEPRPGPGEVLLRVKRIGICGSDIHVNHGLHPFTSYPVVQGHEFSGVVEAVGEGVSAFRPGDKATATPQIVCGECRPCLRGDYHICDTLKVQGFQAPGCAQDLFVTSAEQTVKLPDQFTFEQGAMVEPTAVAVHAASRAGEVAGRNVVVLGAGPIGNLVAQVCRAGGANVLVTDLSDFRLGIARQCGLANTSSARQEELADAVGRVFGESGFGIALECVGVEATLSAAIGAIGKGGRIVVVGVFGEKPRVAMGLVQDRELMLIGTLMYRYPDYERAVAMISSGEVLTSPLETEHFPFEKYADAYRFIDEHREESMKVFVDVSP
jgi:2-desacetyl-2-hydroxyethyl bacteriochlorophyllide A dehydrogenase